MQVEAGLIERETFVQIPPTQLVGFGKFDFDEEPASRSYRFTPTALVGLEKVCVIGQQVAYGRLSFWMRLCEGTVR